MQYQDWFTLYLSTYKRDLKPRTREEYERQHRVYIAPVIGEKPLEDISPEDCQAIINAAAENGERISQAVFALLRASFRRAVRSRRLQWSPMDAVDRPKHRPETGNALTQAVYLAVVPEISDDLSLSLALFAGLRRAEIAGLKWGDVDLVANVLHVRRIRHRVGGELIDAAPKSAAGVRDIPIAPELLPILRRCYRLTPSARCIDVAPEALDRRWKRVQADLDLSRRYRLHDLRHTYVTRAILSGINPRVVQYLAGHSSLELTLQVYSHITIEAAQAEIRRVASLH